MKNDADRELGAWAARHHGIFTLDEARAFGLTQDQIERRELDEWIRVHERVFRAAGAPLSWRSDLYAACRAAEAQPAAVSHWALAGLHDLPMGRVDRVEIACVRWKRTVKT